jgi:type II secretory pathway component PulM
MYERWIKLKNWWSNLKVREQQAIMIGGTVIGVFIIYQFIWSALVNHVAAMRHQIVTEQKELVWMQAADKEIQQIEGHSKNKGKSTTPVMLLSFLQKQINQTRLESQLSQLKQTSNDAVEMHFQKIEFDKFIRLLTIIIKEQPVSISQLSITAESAPGIVNADVNLVLSSRKAT